MFAFRVVLPDRDPVNLRVAFGHEPWRSGDDGDDDRMPSDYGPGFGQTLRALALIAAVLIGIGVAKYMIWGAALPGHLGSAQTEQGAAVDPPVPAR